MIPLYPRQSTFSDFRRGILFLRFQVFDYFKSLPFSSQINAIHALAIFDIWISIILQKKLDHFFSIKQNCPH